MGKRINLADLAGQDYYVPAKVSAAARDEPAAGAVTVPIGSVILNPLNKRPVGEDDEIEGMAETIRQFGSVIQPLVVCSAAAFRTEYPAQAGRVGDAAWVALIGNRRLMACRRAGVGTVPVIVNDDLVSSMFEAMLVENGHHRSLPPLLEAEAMAEVLAKERISQRELGRRVGKSHVYVAQRLSLLKLVPELRAAFERGELTIETAREFGDLPVAEQERIVAGGKPYRRGGRAVTRPVRRTIRVTSPATAVVSLRERFSAEEMAELVRLLMDDH